MMPTIQGINFFIALKKPLNPVISPAAFNKPVIPFLITHVVSFKNEEFTFIWP